jgi:hypothetical protein
MQVIYNYVPETNRVARLHTVAAVLYLQFIYIIIIITIYRHGDEFFTESYHLNRITHKDAIKITKV